MTFNNEDEGFELWLCELLATHESFQDNPTLTDFCRRFLTGTHEFHKDHGNQLLYCRGQERVLVSLEQAAAIRKKHSLFARWYDFLHLGAHSRHSGPTLEGDSNGQTKRRFEAVSIKIQAARNRTKFGMTDDTGYLFPCLQHNVPRACFLVMDHLQGNVFIIHGNKKFAGQGDEGVEEGTNAPDGETDLHAPPVKCFPGTEKLKPTHYIFTWKANGKNAGVYGYTDPVSKDIWLFVNSKGVCECAGLLKDIMDDNESIKKSTTFSNQSIEDTGQLPPHIYRCFHEIWNDGVNRDMVLSLWARGYLLLFEFNDNKHVVLEHGRGGRPVDHLAFIGMVQLPELGSVDSVRSGLVFKVDGQFTFDLWRGAAALRAPAQTCKPTLLVKVEHLEVATQELVKGRFFHKNAAMGEWFDPDSSKDRKQFLAGEGAVCYEMALDDATGESVIRQLFKAKTASYITHRQFREFMKRARKDDDGQFTTFPAQHRRVLAFCRRKFGDLTSKPYPDPKGFCQGQTPSDVVAAAALFYTHFAMWLQERAIQLDSTPQGLIDMMGADILVPPKSEVGRDYHQNTAKLLGLSEEDVLRQTGHGPMVAIRCGMAFRLAEFTAIHGLDHSEVFADPKAMVKILEERNFAWENVPKGYEGEIVVGFNHAFPGGETPKLTKEEKKKQKGKKKQKVDILGPFRKTCSVFLASNPHVKVILGRRGDEPDRITFATSVSAILVSSEDPEKFNAGLLALPSLVADKGPTDYLAAAVKTQRLPPDSAVLQAEETWRQSFPAVKDVFDTTTPINLQFGDVTGRLVPMIRSSTTTSKMLIIRGVSGVGKSSVAKSCQRLWGGPDHIPVVEADDYFGASCPFNPELLSTAHEDAQNRAREALEDTNTHCLVVSNTGIKAREYASYLRLAVARGASVMILTLDTDTPLGFLQNLHDVPHKKVEKMADGLRAPENNPEGKSIEAILETADRQDASDQFNSNANAALAWTLLDAEGVAAIQAIYVGFLNYAKDQGIAVPPATVRPPNPHSTLVFVRPSSNIKELKRMASLWSQHGATQEMTLGEVKYSTRTIATGKKVLLSVAVAVTSSSPTFVERETPHITLAYDADNASASDSNKLWLSGAKWADGVSVGRWDPQHSSTTSGTVEAGALKGDGIAHQMPVWLRNNKTITESMDMT